MSESFFSRLFRSRSSSSNGASAPPLVGGFGKHPAWDDHIPDTIGPSVPRLLELKQSFYVQGIGGNVDNGAWDRLDPSMRIEFAHELLWTCGDEVIAGRLWHSSDGKGRERYPMIVCACLYQTPLSWI